MNSLNELTQMEKRVLRLLAENKTSKEIAGELFVSYRTVQNHRTNIANKLDLKGPNKLLQFAIENKDYLSAAVERNFEPEDSTNPLGPGKGGFSLRKPWILLGIAGVLVLVIATTSYLLRISNKSDAAVTNDTQRLESVQPDKNRVAVLPFTNISREAADEFLADGMTEELITTLSKINGLRVIASTSVMKYKEAAIGISEIREELKVGTILEGSVRKLDDKLRVSAQLIDTSTEEHIWAQDYDRDLKDIFEIQTDIAQRVATGLQLKLLSPTLTDQHRPVNDATYANYLKGRYFWNQRTEVGFEKALEYFTAAIELDPDYALAYAGLADTYILLSNYYYMAPDEAFPKAKKAALKALEIDDQLAEAHNSLACIHYLYDWDFFVAEIDFKRAIYLNPNYASAYQVYAICLANLGRFEEAIKAINKALELDPISRIINAVVGRVYHKARQYDKALEHFQKTIEIDPNFFLVYVFAGETYLCKGMQQEALRSFRKAVESLPSSAFPKAALAFGYAATGEKAQAIHLLEEILSDSENRKRLSYQIATIYTALDDPDEPFNWLELAYRNKHDFLLDMKVDQKLDVLRSDPRFKIFLAKMGLEKTGSSSLEVF